MDETTGGFEDVEPFMSKAIRINQPILRHDFPNRLIYVELGIRNSTRVPHEKQMAHGDGERELQLRITLRQLVCLRMFSG